MIVVGTIMYIISVIRKAKNNSNHLFLPPRDDNKFDYSYNYHRQYAVRDKLLFSDIWEMKNLYNFVGFVVYLWRTQYKF